LNWGEKKSEEKTKTMANNSMQDFTGTNEKRKEKKDQGGVKT
jgi:hypothetical protein